MMPYEAGNVESSILKRSLRTTVTFESANPSAVIIPRVGRKIGAILRYAEIHNDRVLRPSNFEDDDDKLGFG